LVYQGHFLNVRRDNVLLPNGKQASREYIVHPGAVMIVPLLDDGRLLLERQYRYPMGRVML
jgi:ADP-ribose pyrophosphatase